MLFAVTTPRPAAPLTRVTRRHLFPHRPLPSLARGLAMCLLLPLLLSGCLGGGDDPVTEPAQASAAIGPAGGTLLGPDGVELTVPAGALAQTTTLTITKTADGAPALVEQLLAAGAVYEFTPHNLYFAVPVTIGFPLASNASTTSTLVSTSVFMVSPGEPEWGEQETRVINGKATVARNRLSWGMPGLACLIYSDPSRNSPSGCISSSGYGRITATPSTALHTVTSPYWFGYGGSYTVDAAAQITFSVRYTTAYHCTDSKARLFREPFDPVARTITGPAVKLQEIAAPLIQSTGVSAPFMSAKGTATFAPITLSNTDNGAWRYTLTQHCVNSVTGGVRGGGDTIQVEVSVPVPTTSYTVGGSVSGLTGTGLVLQDNGGDNLAIAADGAFVFAAPVGGGTPYSVTVLTQPGGQVCTVANGSGTANANVSNIAITCAAAPAGKAWQGAALIETDNAGHAESPEIAMDANGNGTAVWLQNDGTRYNVWARRYTLSGGWQAQQIIETGNGDASGAHVAVDARGNAIAVWSQADGALLYNIWTSRFSAGTWSAPQLLEADAGNAFAPRIGLDATGNAIAVWSQHDGAQMRIRASHQVAGVWQTPSTIDGGTGPAYQPKIAVFPGGTAIAAWVQTSGGIDHIFYNRFNGTGWSTADMLDNNNNGYTDAPEIAADANGNAVAVWNQSDGTNIASVYTSRFSGGAWGAVELLETADVSYATGARIAMTASGNAVAVWLQDEMDDTNAWARHYTAGVGWGAPVQLDTPLGFGAESPNVAIDPAGNAIAVWGHAVGSNRRDLYTSRYASGSWDAPALLETDDTGSANYGLVATDANGNAIVVWSQSDGTRQNIWSNVYK